MADRAMRQALKRQRSRSVNATFPGPARGLVLNQSPASPVPQSVEIAENWFPTNRGMRVRGGLLASATTGGDAVVSMFAYNDPGTPKLFAATGTDIYNISGLDPDTAPSADISSQTAGYYSTSQFGTAGGEYLYAVNGTDSALLYDGSSWTVITGVSSPAITGVTTSNLSAVWSFRNRLFFVEKDTQNAWALPSASIGGAAIKITLSGVFKRGGSLLFGATWSLDSGDGQDDRCVFISTEGEVAIYEGTDPSSASTWALVGRYDIAKPLGIKSALQAGGDLVIATVDGLVPLSEAVQKDPAALSLSAVSRPIEPLWLYEARRATSPVELIKWADRGFAIAILPESNRVPVIGLQTGAWGMATGWDLVCGAVFAGKCYAGRSDGSIVALDETGFDDTAPYTARLCSHSIGQGNYMTAEAVRHVFFAPSDFAKKTSAAVNYNASDFPAAPNAAVFSSSYMTWDVDNWDEALWWSKTLDENSVIVTTAWETVTGAGHALASQLQITIGQTQKPNIELIRTDLVYRRGRVVA